MQRITINTGLNEFLLLDRLTQADSATIHGTRTFSNAPAYLGLESLAQLGALHVRYLTGFERHAFLLKIIKCVMPVHDILNGTYALSGTLISQSRSGFCHTLQAKEDDVVRMEGQFLFASADYDQRFKQERLKNHYQNVFSCLQSDLKKD